MVSPVSCLDLPSRPIRSEHGSTTDRSSRRERIFALVYRQMVVLAGRSADLEDLTQTAAEQALRSLDTFNGRSELATWTYKICHNTLLKQRRWYHRWFKRFAFSEDSSSFEPLALDTDHDRLEREERAARLWAALGKLSPKRRVVLVLHDLEGLDIGQIAEIVACNPLTVRSRLRDGRKLLARELESDPYFGTCACKEAT